MKKAILALSVVAVMSLNAETLANVNGHKILSEDFANIPNLDFKKLSQEQKKQLIDQAIDVRLMIDEAKKLGIQNDKDYKKSLENLQNQVLVDTYMKKVFDKIKVSDAEIKNFYDKNQNMFKQPAQVKAKHILFSLEKEQDAKDTIKALKSLKGENLSKKFSEIAKEKSIDKGSALKGGELGWFDASNMVKPFSDAAFSLKKGEISQTPVKSQFGYHIIFKEDEKKEDILPFNDVKNEIENSLKLQTFRAKMQDKLQDLRKNAKITYSK